MLCMLEYINGKGWLIQCDYHSMIRVIFNLRLIRKNSCFDLIFENLFNDRNVKRFDFHLFSDSVIIFTFNRNEMVDKLHMNNPKYT